MTLLTLLLMLAPILLGIAALVRWQISADQITAVLIGTIAGPVVFFTVLYAITWIITPSPLLLWIAVAVTASMAAWLARPARAIWPKLMKQRSHLVVVVLMLLLATLLAPNLLLENENGLHTAILHAWGDLGWHMANISMFEVGQSFPPQNPILAGERLTYPFLTNFVSGMFRVAGASYSASVVFPAIIWLAAGLSLVFIFTRVLTRSSVAATVALILVIGSGSTLGWTTLQETWQTQGGTLIDLLLHLPNNLSGNSGDADGYHFVNIILAGLLPQRSFLLGLPLALSLVLVLLGGLKYRREAHFITAGIIAGVLPLTHAHSVVALVPLILLLFGNSLKRASETRERKELGHLWLVWVLTTIAVGLPQVLYFALNKAPGSSFIRWEPGWSVGEHPLLSYWFGNSGFMIPLVVLVLALPWLTRNSRWHPPRYVWLVGITGAILFAASNMYSFAPWVWDNYKLLVYWFVFSTPLLGWLVAQLVQQRNKMIITTIVLMVFFQIATGLLDLTRVALPTTREWGEWDTATIAFAQSIKQLTDKTDVIATAPYHNNPVALTGRPMYLGFPGHVWTHGHNYAAREVGIREYYQGRGSRLPEIEVEYIVVGPVERQHFPDLTVRDSWRLVTEVGPHRLYKLNAFAQNATSLPNEVAQ